MIATVDSFIRIFKFYQENELSQYFLDRGKGTTGTPDGIYDRKNGKKVIDPRTGKYKRISINEIFKKNHLRYDDTVDIYLNSLVLDKYTQLSYDTDSETIVTALSAREQMKKYFNEVIYPGSYAFNTTDNASFRKMILDWTSTIKTIQDSNKRLTDAYSLSSEDVDKALRGFGTSFINSYTLSSVNRRKNFLLNVCDLYSIKGTPESIVRALNIIGLNNIFIREGWMFKDTDDGDIKIDWQPVKQKSVFNEITKQYESLDTDNEFVTDWNWFENKIAENSHSDPHWMYTKSEILELNDDPDVYLKLPSITPYFGIEFISDVDVQIDAMETVYSEIDKQFRKYLSNKELESDYKYWLNEYDSKLSILQAYTGLIYSLIRLDDHLLYENFKSFLASCEIQNIPDFTGKYEYFQIIYWFYINYKLSDKPSRKSQFNFINSFIPIKSQDYCSYEQVLRWWLTCDYNESEAKKIRPIYIYPDKLNDAVGFIELGWTAPFEYGRYGVQVFSESRISERSDGWMEIRSGEYSYQTNMNVIVSTEEADGFGSDINNFRIVYYHTPANIPDIFFNPPFNLNNQLQDTFLDRTVRYNGPSVSLSYYNDNIIKNAFVNQNIKNSSAAYDVVSGYHKSETMSTKTRFTDIDTTMRSMYASYLNYPNLHRLYEDKWMNINNDFYNFVDWSIRDFTDTKSHEGLMYNNRNMIHSYGEVSVDQSIIGKILAFDIKHENEVLFHSNNEITREVYNTLVEKKIEKVFIFTENSFRKYPVNSKWNWAVDTNYVYFCYESNKWCRVPCTIVDSSTISLPTTSMSYGDKFVINDQLYIYVSNNKVAKIDCETTWDVNESDILPTCSAINPETGSTYWKDGRIKENSELSRDLAVAKITDSYILDLIYQDCTLTKNDKKRNSIMKVLKTEEIEVYQDPYGANRGETFNYETFLTYLYNSRLILDFDTGYIYPNYQAVKCDSKLYFKSYINSNDRIWVRIQPEFEWSDCKKNGIEAETIYKDWQLTRDVDNIVNKAHIDVNKSQSTNLGFLMPPYTLPNRYDSLRFLDGPVYDSITDLQTASDNDEIDKSVNYVLVRTDDGPIVCRRVVGMNDTYTNYTFKWERCLDNRIYDCNFGIGSDLLEFIESRYAQDDQYYINIVNDFSDLINNYMTEELGISQAILDITIANWSTSGIVKKTVNFYKPKRVRLLFISNKIEGDYGINNNLDSIGIGDQEFNYYDLSQYRFGNPGFNKKNLNRMNRTKISHVIDEYLPHSDTIMKLSDDHNQVYSSREIYDVDSKIPSLEVYDQILNLNQQINGDIVASFYVSNLEMYNANGTIRDSRINGFYYKIPNEDIYSNNIYFFKKIPVNYAVTENNKTKIITEYRWAIFRTDQTVFDHSTCYYVANKVTNEPYRDVSSKTDSTVKYAERDFVNHPKYIESLTYDKGEFTWQGSVKTNRRVLEPVFYISQFEKKNCNGFYYQDETLYPNRNDKPVYFNQHGKIISYTKPDWIIPDSYINNEYDADDNWRMTSNNQFYNGKTLIESVYIENGTRYNGYAYASNGITVFFLYWDRENRKWIFRDMINKIRIVLKNSDGIEYDKKLIKCSFTINESVVNIERYQKTNRYWIITDNRQIVEFGDADYFAYCYLNDELIWNPRNSDITKVFHSSLDSSKDTLTWGIRTSCLYDNEDLIDPEHGYVKILNDKYSPYRRNHFNAVELKNKPISYLYCYNGNIRNFYNDDNRIKIETNSSTYSMDMEGNSRGSIEIHNNDNTYLKYTNEALNDKNEWSIAFRMLAFDQQSINSLIGHNVDIIKPNEWFMITMTSNIDYDYYYRFAFDSVKKKAIAAIDNLINGSSSLIDQIVKMKSISVEDVIYSTFTIPLCDTAIGNRDYHYSVVKHFDGITTYQETALEKYDNERLVKIRNSLSNEIKNCIDSFNQVEIPRTETILHYAMIFSGIILNNKPLNYDYNDFYINGIKIRNSFDNSNFLNGLTKQSLHFKDVNVKVSEYALWEYALNDWYCGIISKFRILRSRPEPQKSKTSTSPNNYRPIFALQQPRIVYPIEHTALPDNIKGGRFEYYNADPTNSGSVYPSEINSLWRHERSFDENENLFVKNGAECQYRRKVVNDGKTLISDSNYRVSYDELPFWWIRKESEYKTGPIHHKPVYIAIQEKVNEAYPHIDHGIDDKAGNYHDIGMRFDGVNNRDTSFYDGEEIVVNVNRDKTHFDITFDPVSSFTSEYDRYVLSDDNNNNIIGYARNKDSKYERDYDRVGIYEIARDFYPVDNSDKIDNLRIRFINLDNNGCTYDSEKITDDSIIVPDTAQLTLTKDAMSNGIFHNNLKYYTTDSELNCLCGIWTPDNNVRSYQEGDFNYCYRNSTNEMEAVLTYQRASGYFWWEFRKLDSGIWKTVARTYVQPKHNISKNMIWKDYINWNQIDLVGQKICKFKESDYENFATMDWHLVEQDVIDDTRRFACGSWIKFELEEVPESCIDPVTNRNAYCDGKYLYFRDGVTNKWFRSKRECESDWNDPIFMINDVDVTTEDYYIHDGFTTPVRNVYESSCKGVNGKPRTPSGFLYRNGYLYFYLDTDGKWVRLPISNEISNDIRWSKHYRPWKFYKSRNTSFGYMNVIDSTDADCFDNAYVIPSNIDIIETYAKLIKYNGIGDFDWSKHMGEDIKYPKSVNNDISLCRCSVKDSVYVYVYQINEDGTRTLLNELEASVIRTDSDLIKPDQCYKRYNVNNGKLITDPDIKGYRSMWNFSDFPLYGIYGNYHVSGSVWDIN